MQSILRRYKNPASLRTPEDLTALQKQMQMIRSFELRDLVGDAPDIMLDSGESSSNSIGRPADNNSGSGEVVEESQDIQMSLIMCLSALAIIYFPSQIVHNPHLIPRSDFEVLPDVVLVLREWSSWLGWVVFIRVLIVRSIRP